MRRTKLAGAAQLLALCALLLGTACLGPNNATGRLASWNGKIENRWVRQGVFMVALPAYLIVGIGDNFIFNSIFWWTGNEPIDPPSRDSGPSDLGM